MTVVISDITTKSWSINVSALGEIVADTEDVKQCVMLIVTTVQGTVPFLPEFGCGIYNHIDRPAQSAAPLMIREVRNAVAKWEQRASVINSSYEIQQSLINITLELRMNSARGTDPVSSFFINFTLDTETGIFS